MAQITEDYVGFETAKLLKEKGFDWEESPFYSEQDRDEWRYNNSYEIPNPAYNKDIPFDSETQTMVVPHISIQMAMKWLREIHKRFCSIGYDDLNYNWTIIDISADTDKQPYYASKSYAGYAAYEDACEAAIKYCLENLI